MCPHYVIRFHLVKGELEGNTDWLPGVRFTAFLALTKRMIDYITKSTSTSTYSLRPHHIPCLPATFLLVRMSPGSLVF